MFSRNLNSFYKVERKLSFMFFFIVTLKIVFVGMIIAGIFYLVTNPEIISAFFGKIVSGFKSVQ